MRIDSLTPIEIEDFALLACQDRNPVHNIISNPQYVPGDWLFSNYVDFLEKLPVDFALTFGGQRGVVADEKMHLTKNGISTKDAGLVLKLEKPVPMKF